VKVLRLEEAKDCNLSKSGQTSVGNRVQMLFACHVITPVTLKALKTENS
jgi:hypothetical protein